MNDTDLKTKDMVLELKAASGRQFEGYGSVFNNIDLGGDIVMPGAFAKTLAAHKAADNFPRMFWMHKADQVPGAWTAMHEDSNGLYVKGELAKTPLGDEMHELLNIKAVRGLSIGYKIEDAAYDRQAGANLLKELDLWEVSIVSLAMNPLAAVKSAIARLSERGEYVPTERDFELCLRGMPRYSRKVAVSLTAKVFDAPSRGILEDEIEPEEAAILKSLEGLTDKFWAEAFRR